MAHWRVAHLPEEAKQLQNAHENNRNIRIERANIQNKHIHKNMFAICLMNVVGSGSGSGDVDDTIQRPVTVDKTLHIFYRTIYIISALGNVEILFEQ